MSFKKSNQSPNKNTGQSPSSTFGRDEMSTHPSSNASTGNIDLPIEFGRYQLLKQLGTGGMGTVYLAHDTELDRKIALKLPHFNETKSKQHSDRFRREARLAATLDHPNICRILDIGEHNGRQFLTMAYVEGRSLHDIIKAKGAIEPRIAVKLMQGIATTVHFAHEQGIIHRDLKPANIMIRKDKSFVIMDFGLARRIEQGDEQLTAAGAVLGTPAYMSPEQLESDEKAVGPQSDIYSLGIILNEMLTGRRPFQGSTPQIYAQILTSDSVAPSSIGDGIDLKLCEICRKATNKERSKRCQTAREFAAYLSDYLSLSTIARVSTPEESTGNSEEMLAALTILPSVKRIESRSRKRSLFIAATSLICIVLLGCFWMFNFGHIMKEWTRVADDDKKVSSLSSTSIEAANLPSSSDTLRLDASSSAEPSLQATPAGLKGEENSQAMDSQSESPETRDDDAMSIPAKDLENNSDSLETKIGASDLSSARQSTEPQSALSIPRGNDPKVSRVTLDDWYPYALMGRTEPSKSKLLLKHGGTITTEKSVEEGLQWLARQQYSDGSWSLVGPYSSGAATENKPAGTAMALLAFLGTGNTSVSGNYKMNVSKGLSYLKRVQDKNGFFDGGAVGNSRAYAQALCTIAICEALAMTGDRELDSIAKNSVHYAKFSQGKNGGWRYNSGDAGDTSVTGWFVAALSAAKMAKIDVDQTVLELANRFLDKVQITEGEDTQYSYQPAMSASLSMTASGMLSRLQLGLPFSDSRLTTGANFLGTAPISRVDNRGNFYYYYHAASTLHHIGGKYWESWNGPMKDVLTSLQIESGKEKGSWSPEGDSFDVNGGRLYATCFAIFCLESYYRYAPICDVSEAQTMVDLKSTNQNRDPTTEANTPNEWSETMKRARSAIEKAEFETFHKLMDRAFTLSTSDETKDKLARLDQLGQLYEIFIAAMREAKSKMRGTEVITVGKNKVNIVEVKANELVIRILGKTEKYAWDRLPPGVAMAMADLTLGDQDPTDIAARAVYFSLSPVRNELTDNKVKEWFEKSVGKGQIRNDLPQALVDTYD